MRLCNPVTQHGKSKPFIPCLRFGLEFHWGNVRVRLGWMRDRVGVKREGWILKRPCRSLVMWRTLNESHTLCCRLSCTALWCDVFWSDVMCCYVKWCVVMWCVVIWCDVMWCDIMWCDILWCVMLWSDVLWWDGLWCNVKWCDVK